MYDLVKSHGKFVLIHTCGKIQKILPDFIEVGVDIFNPFQPEVMDVVEIKKEYGQDICFYGGISIQKTLPFGSVQEVRDEVRFLLDEIGRDGGYIASPSHDIPGDAKADNMAAMIEVLQPTFRTLL
jgi:uroporphyrinogen decarboxylase